MIRLISVLTVFLAVASTAGAATLDSSHRLLKLVGYDVFAAGVSANFAKPPDTLEINGTIDVAALWRRAARGKVRQEDLMDSAAQEIAEQMSEYDVEALITYFSDGLGARVTALEVAAQDPAQADQVEADKRAYIEGLDETFGHRLTLLSDLADATDAVDTGVMLYLNLSFAVTAGMIASGELDYEPTEEELLSAILETEPQVRDTVTTDVIASAAYTYRALSDAELTEYAAFLRRDPGRKFYAIAMASFAEILTRDARALGHDLMIMGADKDI